MAHILIVNNAEPGIREFAIPIEKIILKKRKELKIPYSKLAPLGRYPAIGQHMTRKSVEAFIKLSGSIELNKFLKYRYEKVKRIDFVNKSELV